MTAEWLHDNDDRFDWYECSNCGYGDDYEVTEISQLSRYCPACGKMMKNSTWPPNKDIGACGDNYFANMVSASSDDGYEQLVPYDEDDSTWEEPSYYKAYSYYGSDYRGIEDTIDTSDPSVLMDWIWEHAAQGGFIEVCGPKGCLRLDPDDLEERVANGDIGEYEIISQIDYL